MNAIYTNHLTTLHNMIADVRRWAPCARREALIEEYEAQIEEYTELLHADLEAGTVENEVCVESELEEAVGWARGAVAVAVADARKVGAQLEAMAPGCGATQGDYLVWSVRVECEDGARGEVRLVVTRGRKSGSLRWING